MATFVWGSGHPVGKLILAEITPLQLAMSSSFLTAFTIFMVLLFSGRLKNIRLLRGRSLSLSLLSGSIIFFIYPILSFSALQRIPASVNSILVATSTLFVAALSPLLLNERLKKMGIISIIVSFIGVPLIVFSVGTNHGFTGYKTISIIGCSLSLTGAVASAIFTIIGRKVSGTCGALYVTLAGSFFGGLLLAPIVGFTTGYSQILSVSPKVLGLVAYWGIFSGLGYAAYYYVLERIEAIKASSFIYLSPFFAIILSVIILGEKISFLFIVGAALVFLGIFGIQKNKLKV